MRSRTCRPAAAAPSSTSPPDVKTEWLGELREIQTRIDDARRHASDAKESRLPAEIDARAVDQELSDLTSWVRRKTANDPPDKAAVAQFVRAVSGGRTNSADAVPLLLALVAAVHPTSPGAADGLRVGAPASSPGSPSA